MRALVVSAVLVLIAAPFTETLAHAGNGTLVVEAVNARGHRTAADCEVRVRGQRRVVKRLNLGAGLSQIGIAGGSYDVSCKARVGGLTGKRTVTVASRKTMRCRIALKKSGTTALRTYPVKTVEPAGLSGQVLDRRNRPLNGTMQIVITVPVRNGRFNAGMLPAGNYLLRFFQGRKVKMQKNVRVKRSSPTKVKLKMGSRASSPSRRRL